MKLRPLLVFGRDFGTASKAIFQLDLPNRGGAKSFTCESPKTRSALTGQAPACSDTGGPRAWAWAHVPLGRCGEGCATGGMRACGGRARRGSGRQSVGARRSARRGASRGGSPRCTDRRAQGWVAEARARAARQTPGGWPVLGVPGSRPDAPEVGGAWQALGE